MSRAPGATGGTGEEVLAAAVAAARGRFGEGLVAAYAIGSLAHGGFAPLVSDVDLALVLRAAGPTTPAEIAGLTADVRGLSPLAERLSVFWSDPAGVRTGPGPDDRLPAVDRLDLVDHGRLLHGADVRAGAVRPDAAQLVAEGAAFAVERFDGAYLARLRRPAELVAAGPRAVTKAVLFPVRFLYTLHTGRIGLNADAAEHYAEHGAHPAVARAATVWREHGISDPVAATDLLGTHLVGLYREFVDAYAAVARDPGELHALRDRLGAS